MKRTLIAMAALSAMGASASWARRTADEPHGHALRAIDCGGLRAADEDDLAGLSEQERAALAEPTGGEDEATLRAIAGKTAPAGTEAAADAGTDADGEEEEDDEATGDPAAVAATADAKAQAQATADAAAASAATEAEKVQAAAGEKKPDPAGVRTEEPVSYSIAAPEDADAQIKALRAEKAAEFKKLMDGELSPEEYSAKEDEILGKIGNIQSQVTKAETAAEISVQNAQRSYLGRVNALLDRARADDGVDYRAPENKHLHEALDRTVKWLANDPSNADKPEQWFLDEAHSLVKGRFNVGKTPAAAPAGEGAGKPAAKGGKAPDLSGVPPTVRTAPPAAGSDDGGEFAHLNNLKGMELERAVARMSNDQQQRWAEAS